jgi:hypothetical protein
VLVAVVGRKDQQVARAWAEVAMEVGERESAAAVVLVEIEQQVEVPVLDLVPGAGGRVPQAAVRVTKIAATRPVPQDARGFEPRQAAAKLRCLQPEARGEAVIDGLAQHARLDLIAHP